MHRALRVHCLGPEWLHALAQLPWSQQEPTWTVRTRPAAHAWGVQRLAIQLLQRDASVPMDGHALTASIHGLCAGQRFKRAEALLKEYMSARPGDPAWGGMPAWLQMLFRAFARLELGCA